MESLRQPRTLALVFAALGLLAIYPYIPAARSPNELCRLAQTVALWDHHTPEITQVLARVGRVGDLSRVDAYALGRPIPHYYPSKAPLLSYLAVPVYAVMEALHGGGGVRADPRDQTWVWADSGAPAEESLVFFARLFITVLPAVLVLWPLRRFLEAHFDPELSALLLVGYALGTICFPYAELFMSHGLTAIALFLVYDVLWRHKRGELATTPAFLLAGLLAGLSVATEYTAALGLVPLAIYALATTPADKRLRAAILGIAGVLPAALFLAWYHWRCFGSPFETGYLHLNDVNYQHWHNHGFLGIGAPSWEAFWRSFLDPLRGLFVVSPFLVLALPGLVQMYRRQELRPEWGLALAELGFYTYFTSGFAYDSWGWTTGPRHMTPLAAFLLLPIGASLQWAREKGAAWVGAASGLVVLSIVNTGLLTQVNYISDCLRNGLHRLAVPLFLSGHLPNSPLTIIGIPNPWGWLPEGLALVGAMGLVLWVASRGFQAPVAALAGVGVAVALFLVHSAIPSGPNTQCEDDTLHNLARDFLPQPGRATTKFWRSE